MAQGLYAGCVAPVKTVVVVSTDSADFDLSTATAGRIVCRFHDDTDVEWEAVLSDESATAVTLTREHAADDIPAGMEGTAYIHAELDIPASDEPIVTTARPVPILRIGS